MTTLRVAAAQFATGTDVDANLATVLRMLDQAAATGAQLVVLPEFCNHLSIYDDPDHAWEVAVERDGEFVSAVAAAAARHHLWVQLNVTLRRAHNGGSSGRQHHICNSNLLIDPSGSVVAISDKTVLMGAEGDHLTPSSVAAVPVPTDFGVIGSYSCMDGVVPEVPRLAAVQGARLLLNSLNSFARDEAELHIPVRAAENRAWVVACCKVGPLLPPEKEAAFSEAMGVPAALLRGAGESQIVAPNGRVVAMGPRDEEAVVVADIDLAESSMLRPDGSDLWSSRRPGIYQALAHATPPLDDHPRAEHIDVAVVGRIDQLPAALTGGAHLVVLPEQSLDDPADLDRVRSDIAEHAAEPGVVVIGSRLAHGAHVGLAIDVTGVIFSQAPLHSTGRHPGSELADRLECIDLPWGRLALCVGDDLLYPEVARMAALEGVDVLASPFLAHEEWDTALAAPERAAENRIITVVATSPLGVGHSVISDLPPDPTLWAPTRVRPFNGTINQPDSVWANGSGAAYATVHPARTTLRQISRGTDLVDGRPWELCARLTQ